jgi:hypothetical protein
MLNNINISQLLDNYLSKFSDEKEKLSLLNNQISEKQDLFTRKNFK